MRSYFIGVKLRVVIIVITIYAFGCQLYPDAAGGDQGAECSFLGEECQHRCGVVQAYQYRCVS